MNSKETWPKNIDLEIERLRREINVASIEVLPQAIGINSQNVTAVERRQSAALFPDASQSQSVPTQQYVKRSSRKNGRFLWLSLFAIGFSAFATVLIAALVFLPAFTAQSLIALPHEILARPYSSLVLPTLFLLNALLGFVI